MKKQIGIGITRDKRKFFLFDSSVSCISEGLIKQFNIIKINFPITVKNKKITSLEQVLNVYCRGMQKIEAPLMQ